MFFSSLQGNRRADRTANQISTTTAERRQNGTGQAFTRCTVQTDKSLRDILRRKESPNIAPDHIIPDKNAAKTVEKSKPEQAPCREPFRQSGLLRFNSSGVREKICCSLDSAFCFSLTDSRSAAASAESFDRRGPRRPVCQVLALTFSLPRAKKAFARYLNIKPAVCTVSK